MNRHKVPCMVFCLLACAALAMPGAEPPASGIPDRSEAYYNYSMGHLYSELAEIFGNRGDYLARAIEYYRQALKADPSASLIHDELAGLYFRAGRINEAVTELTERIRKDPSDINARRLLGRIYLRLIGDEANNRINPEMLNRAREQFLNIVELDPKDLEAWIMLGRLHHVARQPAEAEKAFRRALELAPGNEDAMTGLAMVYGAQGDNQRAVEVLKELAERTPNLRTLTNLAEAYESMRDFASAAEVLKRALDLDPSDPELKRGLAQNLHMAGKLEEALKAYEELAALDPRNPEAHLSMFQIYRRMGKLDKARQALEEAKQRDPENLEVLFNEVGLLELEGRYKEAIAALRKILEATEQKSYNRPERMNRLVFLERLGMLYRSVEQYEQAVETFTKMGELDPEAAPRAAIHIVDTWREARQYQKALDQVEAAARKFPRDQMIGTKKAAVLAELGKTAEAINELNRVFGSDKGREYWLSLAEVYERARNYTEMARALDEAEKLTPEGPDRFGLHFMRGAMYERTKQYELAEAEFRKALAIEPDSPHVLNYLGYMFADRNVRLEEAQQLIHRALELDPQNGAYLDSLGWVYYRMGRLEEAEKYLRMALQRLSRDPVIRDHLGDVLFQMGRIKEAITEWEASLREWEASPPSEKDPEEMAKVSKKLEKARIRLAQEAAKKGRTR